MQSVNRAIGPQLALSFANCVACYDREASRERVRMSGCCVVFFGLLVVVLVCGVVCVIVVRSDAVVVRMPIHCSLSVVCTSTYIHGQGFGQRPRNRQAARISLKRQPPTSTERLHCSLLLLLLLLVVAAVAGCCL